MRITISISEDLVKKIVAYCKGSGRTVSGLIQKLLQDELERALFCEHCNKFGTSGAMSDDNEQQES